MEVIPESGPNTEDIGSRVYNRLSYDLQGPKIKESFNGPIECSVYLKNYKSKSRFDPMLKKTKMRSRGGISFEKL